MAKYIINFHVDLNEKREFENGERIDYRKIYHIPNVIKGQLVAELIEKEDNYSESKYIFDSIEEAKSLFSNDFYYSKEKPIRIYANISGKIYEKDGRFFITNVLEVENVDFSTGDIFFVGDLIVKQEIKSGFEVKAKNIYVNGNVNNSIIAAGEKIIVKGGIIGIQGEKNCYIKAGKLVAANFVENSIIECKGSVYIKKSSMHSDIYSGEKIIIENPGLIVGGNSLAKRSILARVVGSKWGTYTLLKVGIDPFKYLKLKALMEKKEKREKLYEEINKSLTYLEEVLNEGKGTEEEKNELREEIKKINLKKNELVKSLRRLKSLIIKLKTEIEEDNAKSELKGGKIFIFEKVFPGVEVKVGLQNLKISEEINNGVIFYLEGEEVQYKELS